MSTEIIDVASPANVAPTVEPTSFAELQKSWTPEQRREWDLTGKEPESTVPPKTETVESQPEPVKAKAEPASGAGEPEEDHEPEYFGTPEQQKAQKHAFARLKRERAEARAEAKILREQLAGKQTAAPAAAPKAEPKQPGLVKPVRPRMDDPKYSVSGVYDTAQYDADLDAYEEARDSYKEAKAQADREEAETRKAQHSRAELWASELKTGRETHADFDAVAFSPNVLLSHPMVGVITGMKGAAEVLYYFGQNPEVSKELADLTDVPGYQSYEDIVAAAKSDPSLKIQLGIAEGLVKAEVRRIQSGKKDPTPKPITVSRAEPPAEKVNASASITKDPIKEASDMYDKTGDHKYLALMNRLMDERDRAALRRS